MANSIAIRSVTVALAVALAGPLTVGASGGATERRERQAASRVVEIRSYNLKPGMRDRFHQLFLHDALPMLQRWKVDVVAYGPSLHDADSYYLMRGYGGVEDRQRSEDAFYGSDEWKQGPREAILACIDTYATVVIALDEATIRGLRK